MRAYLSGPITNHEDTFEENFKKAADHVKTLEGFRSVVSPVEIGKTLESDFRLYDVRSKPEWVDYMKADIKAMMACDTIVMLPGWAKSKGALIEKRIADDLGFKVIYWWRSRESSGGFSQV